MSTPIAKGVVAVLAAVVLWGVQLPVAKLAFENIDPYHVTAIRYGIATVILVPLLVWSQGLSALRYRGRFWSLSTVGVVGMSISPLLTYLGLSYSRPEHAAIISALQPLMVAIAQWWLKAARPSVFTWACIGTAFFGVSALLTGGRPVEITSSNELFGDALIFGGAVAWVTFAISSEGFKDRTPLSFTTLTIVPGTIATFLVLATVQAANVVSLPTAAAIQSAWWQLLYLSFGSVILAMYCWNVGNQRIGPLNAMLFVNLQSVVTFAVVFLQGRRFSAIEIGGATIVIGALLAHSLHLRAKAASPKSTRLNSS